MTPSICVAISSGIFFRVLEWGPSRPSVTDLGKEKGKAGLRKDEVRYTVRGNQETFGCCCIPERTKTAQFLPG